MFSKIFGPVEEPALFLLDGLQIISLRTDFIPKVPRRIGVAAKEGKKEENDHVAPGFQGPGLLCLVGG